MKRSQVAIRWREGLHLRTAAKLVRRTQSFRSSISLRIGQRVADARSILAVLLLCGTVGTVVDLEVSGPDEGPALAAMESLFDAEDAPGPDGSESVDQADKPIT